MSTLELVPTSRGDSVRVFGAEPISPKLVTSRSFVRGNRITGAGEPCVLMVWIDEAEFEAPSVTSGSALSVDDFSDAETLELLSSAEFMAALSKAEAEIASGEIVSGEELRRRG